MRGLLPKLFASKLQPVVQGFQRWKAWCGLKEPMTRILNILLDLAFLPAGRRIAKFRLIEIVAGHCHEADIEVPLFATAYSVIGRAHVAIDPSSANATKGPSSTVIGD